MRISIIIQITTANKNCTVCQLHDQCRANTLLYIFFVNIREAFDLVIRSCLIPKQNKMFTEVANSHGVLS